GRDDRRGARRHALPARRHAGRRADRAAHPRSLPGGGHPHRAARAGPGVAARQRPDSPGMRSATMIADGERMREVDDGERAGAAPQDERGWGDRIAEAATQAGDLLKTRVEIFREEAAVKAAHAARGAAGMAIAIGLAVGALLLFAAFLAALLARLFGSVPLGILGAFVIYAGLAALFGWRASQALSKVR